MPKSLPVDPKVLRKSSKIKMKDIPVNRYAVPFAEAANGFRREELVGIFRDMLTIREFETMLNTIKTTGVYHGIEYNHPGPAHLSIGQEASAVGQAYVLDIDDVIFGSHRSHGEIVAKGFSAIEKCEDERLFSIMKNYFDGAILRVVEQHHFPTTKSLARGFLLYGTLAEIWARTTGFNRGLGGSMHAFFTPFGIYPNNAIVGGSADISVGAALFKKCNRQSGIVVCNIGDASLGCGPVWEALCLATMGQYTQLWEGDYQGGLPLIFNFMNNHYGMGGQTSGETMGFDMLTRVGAGVNPEQMHAERVDGYNPLAVIDIFQRKKKIIRKKQGPCLIDTMTYRISGHSPSDASSYREKEELVAWEAEDSIVAFGNNLREAGMCTQEELETINSEVIDDIVRTVQMVVDPALSPLMNLTATSRDIESVMFSHGKTEKMDERPVEVLIRREENPRVKQLLRRSRSGIDENGNLLPKGKAIQFRDAVFEAIFDAFYTDPTLIAYGEENRDWGGAFAVYRGLTESLPYHRLFNTPISEGAIVGSAVGYGLCGGRVIAELMYCDFLGRAGDEVFNQLSKWQAMSAGELRMPVVIRVSVGSKYGAQHSQDWTSLCTHIPGLNVVFPATPYDAKGLMSTALRGTDPVIFFESQRIYDSAEQFHPGGVPQETYEIPLGEPDRKRKGDDITIVTIGATLYTALTAARDLSDTYGMESDIIDLRSLVPLNYKPIIESVKKTGRILLASDACRRGSFLHDVANNITELAFDYLDAPPVVVGSRNWITPAYELEKHFFPQPSWLIDAIHEHILPLPGHCPSHGSPDSEQLRRHRKGV